MLTILRMLYCNFQLKFLLLTLLVIFTNISYADVTLKKLNEYDKFHRQYAQLYLSESIEKEDGHHNKRSH
jgi:hypothetical protein